MDRKESCLPGLKRKAWEFWRELKFWGKFE